MPNVIVYVRAADWKALGEGAADLVRDLAANAIRQRVDGPGDTLNGSGARATSPHGARRTQADRGVASPPGASAPARTIRPDPKPGARR